MGKLIYSGIASLDGFLADEGGDFDWAFPGEELMHFLIDLESTAGTYLYGRTTYELMTVWETMDSQPDQSPGELAFAAAWQRAEKIVYSSTLDAVSTERTTLRRSFDADEVRRLKQDLPHDLLLGGPGLASSAVAAGVVDEWHVFLTPTIVGGGLRFFPARTRTDLTLQDSRTFGNGFVFLRYAITG